MHKVLIKWIWIQDSQANQIISIIESEYCQAPGPGLDQTGPWPGHPGHQLGQTKQWPTSSPTWPNLALILTKPGPGVDTIIKQATPPPPPLNFSKLETCNLTKPSLDPGKTWARSRHYNQTGHPTTPPPPPLNFSKLERFLLLTAQNKKRIWSDAIIIQSHGHHGHRVHMWNISDSDDVNEWW